jgi:integral membrane protein
MGVTPAQDSASSRRLLNIVLVVGILDFLLLLVLVYVAFIDRNEEAISLLGPIHGVGFLALLGLTGKGASDGRWGWWFPIIVLITGGPIGSLIGEMRLRRRIGVAATG